MSEYYDQIMEGLTDALDYVKGDSTKARSQMITVQPVVEFDAKSVKEVRSSLGMTQVIFAAVMGVSKKTVEAWEHGTNVPGGSSCRLLEMFRSDPSIAQQFVKFN